MHKNKIINKMIARLLSDNVKYPVWELTLIIDAFLEEITELLKQEENVCIKNFGKFVFKPRKSKRYFNINTREFEYKPDTKILVFRPRKHLKVKSNPK